MPSENFAGRNFITSIYLPRLGVIVCSGSHMPQGGWGGRPRETRCYVRRCGCRVGQRGNRQTSFCALVTDFNRRG